MDAEESYYLKIMVDGREYLERIDTEDKHAWAKSLPYLHGVSTVLATAQDLINHRVSHKLNKRTVNKFLRKAGILKKQPSMGLFNPETDEKARKISKKRLRELQNAEGC